MLESGTDPSTNLFTGSFFRLRIPLHWEEEIIEDIACFFRMDMGGALQVAAMRSFSQESFDLKRELLRYFQQNKVDLKDINLYEYTNPNGLPVVSCEYRHEGRFWNVQAIGQGDKMLLVLYNDVEAPNSYLAREIAGILSSIEFF